MVLMKRKHQKTLDLIFAHPTPNTDKGAIASIRHWLEVNGVKP